MTTRTWQDIQRDIEVPSKYGPVHLNITDAKHVHVDANSNGKAVVIHGIERSLSAHVHLWSDGQWHVGPEGETEGQRFYRHIYLSRRDKSVTSDGTFRMRTLIAQEIERVVTEYAAAHPEAFTAGERVNVNNRILRIEQEIVRANELLSSLHEQLAAAKAEEAAL